MHEKIEIRLRDNSSRRQKPQEEFNDSIMSVGDLSYDFTPMSSVQSFMRSSRASEVDSFYEDTTLKNTFTSFSVLNEE